MRFILRRIDHRCIGSSFDDTVRLVSVIEEALTYTYYCIPVEPGSESHNGRVLVRFDSILELCLLSQLARQHFGNGYRLQSVYNTQQICHNDTWAQIYLRLRFS